MRYASRKHRVTLSLLDLELVRLVVAVPRLLDVLQNHADAVQAGAHYLGSASQRIRVLQVVLSVCLQVLVQFRSLLLSITYCIAFIYIFCEDLKQHLGDLSLSMVFLYIVHDRAECIDYSIVRLEVQANCRILDVYDLDALLAH